MATGEPRDDEVRWLEEVAAQLDRLPPGDPAIQRAVTDATVRLLGNGINRSTVASDQAAAHFERLACRLPAGHPMTEYTRFIGKSVRFVRALLAGDTERANTTLTEMVRLADQVPDDHPLLPFLCCGVATAYTERHGLNGDLRDLNQAEAAINRALDAAKQAGGPFAPGTQLHGFLLYTRGHIRMVWNVYDRQLPRVTDAIDDLERAMKQIGPEQAARTDLTSVLDTARVMREQLIAPSGPSRPLGDLTSTAFWRLAETAKTMGRDRIEYPIVAAQAAAGLAMRALSSGDETCIDEAISQLADVCATPGLGLRERPRLLELHGFALLTRYQMKRGARDLSNAIGRLEDARRAVDQELGSPYASGVLLSLASAYRTRGNEALGDTDRAARIGLAGLRELAGDVLLQDSDANALHRARRGSDDATEMARWFLARRQYAAAIGAIELSRGMVLHAATAGAGVAAALAAAGHEELAAAWTARPGGYGLPGAPLPGTEADDELRYRAMRALEGTQEEAALLSPPTPDDIAAALARSRADLLVYLLPEEENGGGMATGMAVLVDQRGAVSWVPLPKLRAGDGSMTAEFVRARRFAETAPDESLPAAWWQWRETLGRACDWAWEAAVGPVVRALPGVRDARGTVTCPARIVLIPVGQLGLIPWHAARRGQGGSPPRYACQDVVFSYASSARQFVESSRRRPRPWSQQPVLITLNDPSLPGAVAEVGYLHAAYYPHANVYGAVSRRLAPDPGGAATVRPDDVLAALPHGHVPGASLLHFSCHGTVTVPVLQARLRLGTDWERCATRVACERLGACREPEKCEIAVSVEAILRQARAAAPPSADSASGGLVVLAACVTDVTEADYDEALSLATAFLAAGSTGVVAARWEVRDKETMLFIAAFHQFLNQFLNTGEDDPARALREAQLWMLGPAREIPEAWPEPLKADAARMATSRSGARLAEVESWAAFTYQGR